MVRGEEGSIVHMDFLRKGKTVSFTITREEIHATVFGEVRDGVGRGYAGYVGIGW